MTSILMGLNYSQFHTNSWHFSVELAK